MRIAVTEVQSNGRFAIRGLPVGEYFAAALAGDRFLQWPNVEQLRGWSGRAPRVVLKAGGATAVNLVVASR